MWHNCRACTFSGLFIPVLKMYFGVSDLVVHRYAHIIKCSKCLLFVITQTEVVGASAIKRSNFFLSHSVVIILICSYRLSKHLGYRMHFSKARTEENMVYQPCTHAQVLPRFWVNRILSVHPPSPKRHHS